MVVLREVDGIKLNKGSLMANGLFNVSTEDDVSFWFDFEQRDELMNMSDEDFVERSEELIAESLVD